MSKIMTWHVQKVTILRRNVPVVCGASYHLLGYWISQNSKIRFRLQVKSYISDWLFSKSRLLASYVSRHKAMAYDKGREKAPSRQLSPKVMNVGILRIMWTIGDSQQIPDLGSSFFHGRTLFLGVLTLWCCTDTAIDVTILQTSWWQKSCDGFGPWCCRKISQAVVA